MNGIFILWRTVRILHKGDEFEEYPLAAHTKFFAKVLTREIIVFRIGVNSSGAFFIEKIVKKDCAASKA